MDPPGNPYRRFVSSPHSPITTTRPYYSHPYPHQQQYRGDERGVNPSTVAMMDGVGLFGSRRIKFGDVLLFFIAVLLAFISLVILIFLFEVSSHKGEVSSLVSRMEVMENLARNVNDASQVLRRALGDPYPEAVSQHSLWGKDVNRGNGQDDDNDDKRESPMHRWLEPRSPDEEAIITDTAADEIVKGIRSAIGLITQVEESRIIESVSQVVQDADGVLTRPELKEILAFVVKLTMHDSQVQQFARKSMELAMHFESVLMPMMDTLSAEMRSWKQHNGGGGDGPKSIEQEIIESQQMREQLRKFGTMAKEIGEGVHDLLAWYKRGGPADAVALGSDMIHTSKELMESPAAGSLVHVLESIDWRQASDSMADATRDVTAILGDIHDSGAVMSSDRALRSVSSLLEDPATRRLLDAAPGIANNMTALLTRPNSQQLIAHSGALIRRLERMLTQAENAGTVEKSSEFLSIMRELLGGLIHGGLHLELGEDESAQIPSRAQQKMGRFIVAPEDAKER